MFEVAIHALGILLDPVRLAILAGGVLLGLVLGVIPGLGGVVGLALLIPFTYNLDAYSAFALLLGMAAVTTISELIPAILFGVPGSIGAAATVLDGHELAKQGQAGRALGAGYMAALIGGIMGAFLLAVALPIIRPVVLYLGSPELLSFCIFGLSMVAVLSGKAPLKGITAACVGLMLAMIGSGSQTGTVRWTFNTIYLWDHLPLIPFTLGLFAMPELAEMAIARTSITRDGAKADFSLVAQWAGARDALRNWWLVLRCSWLGAILGTVPGLGAASIDWIAYGHALRTEKGNFFGRGDIRGVIAPEAANNSKEGGHLIPTIAFGVPSGASMAVLLSAFLLHGLVPGPDMLTKHLDITFSMMWSLTLAHIFGALICLAASGLFARIASVPAGRLVPIVLAMMFVSSIQGSQSWGDLYSLVFFGLVGWIMKYLGWPRPPLMLGFVLGSIFERYFFISTEIYGATWVYRPAVIFILALAVWAMYGPLKSSVAHTIRDFREIKGRKIRFGGTIVFNIAVILLLLVALWSSLAWPWEAKLVPHAAIYVALIVAMLNLVTEIFSAPAETTTNENNGSDVKALHMDGSISFGTLPQSVVMARLFRYFAWLAAFLVFSTTIGFLPAVVLLILLQSRLEFRQSWLFSIAASAIVTGLLWLSFDAVFHLAWPVSMLGEAYPALRDALPFI
jgi:putative tricarboxylic transport membrane protein